MSSATHLVQLLPPGAVWNLDPGSTLRAVLSALGDELDRIRQRGADVIAEGDPRTATETIAEWEEMLGLPDTRVPVLSTVLAERRSAVLSKLVARGGQSEDFFTALCLACGWTLSSISLYSLLRAGFRVGDRVYDRRYAFTMHLTIAATPLAGALTSAQLEAVVRHATHAHIQIRFTYA